ncbi:MAG: D-alanyl-D-alanine carboxypeptidase [Erysipelotrichaceae bacterium]|nr:D-alanyl-D-alanine carboxypeptidase [Erysipelotrichaceae bacterium]
MKKFLILLILLLSFCILPLQAEEEIAIGAEYAYVMDRETGQVLYEKNGEEKMYPASLTKMMSVILAMEEIRDTDRIVTITGRMLAGLYEQNASVVGYEIGDEVSVYDLLCGALLSSGADCVHALALQVDDSLTDFIERMNEKAAEIGMQDTHFTNATGLHDSDHYSTAKDMALLLNYCRQNALFNEIAAMDVYRSAPVASNPAGYPMQSWFRARMHVLGEIPGFRGGKTGFTGMAGYCMASSAVSEGMDLSIIVCDSSVEGGRDALFWDVWTLYDHFFSSYERHDLLQQGELLAAVPVYDTGKERLYEVRAQETYRIDLPAGSFRSEWKLPEELYAPLRRGDEIGHVSFYQDGELLYEERYTLDTDLKLSRIARFERVYLLPHGFTFGKMVLTLFFALLIIFAAVICMLRQKNLRKRKRKYAKRSR